MKISKDYLSQKRDPHLHSPDHVLADELSNKLGDPSHFAFYLKAALTNDHAVIRKIAGEVLEGKSKNPGALFAYLLKKYHKEKPTRNGYSIWLIPDKDTYDNLSRIIKNFAGLTSSISFEPHVTLIGNSEFSEEQFLDALDQLANQVTSFEVDANPVSTDEYFFKSIFIPIEKNKELMAARRTVRKFLGIKKTEKYEPHLSLVYGNVDSKLKLELIRNLTAPLPTRLTLDKVALVKTTGSVAEWKKIKEINLKQ
jgi:2'-5' RNA ligase